MSEYGKQRQILATEFSTAPDIASNKLDPSRESSQKQKDTGTQRSCKIKPKHPYKIQHKPKKASKKAEDQCSYTAGKAGLSFQGDQG